VAKLTEIKTERLLLRQWRKEDLSEFGLLNRDPQVMQYLPKLLTEEESDNLAEKIINLISENGWGFWAVERSTDNAFIGFVGLHEPKYELPVKPCVEIGWRLARKYWGNGYATEAANGVLAFAFNELGLNDVYSFTSVANLKSKAVMERLNLEDTHSNFDHPTIPVDSVYKNHVLYKIDKQRWLDLNSLTVSNNSN